MPDRSAFDSDRREMANANCKTLENDEMTENRLDCLCGASRMPWQRGQIDSSTYHTNDLECTHAFQQRPIKHNFSSLVLLFELAALSDCCGNYDLFFQRWRQRRRRYRLATAAPMHASHNVLCSCCYSPIVFLSGRIWCQEYNVFRIGQRSQAWPQMRRKRLIQPRRFASSPHTHTPHVPTVQM